MPPDVKPHGELLPSGAALADNIKTAKVSVGAQGGAAFEKNQSRAGTLVLRAGVGAPARGARQRNHTYFGYLTLTASDDGNRTEGQWQGERLRAGFRRFR